MMFIYVIAVYVSSDPGTYIVRIRFAFWNLVWQRESKKGLYFTHNYPFLVIHAKGGESISPKQKDRTTTNFKNIVCQICVKKCFFQLVSYFWYNFKLVYPLQN
jgi:hypothetical protein